MTHKYKCIEIEIHLENGTYKQQKCGMMGTIHNDYKSRSILSKAQ